jgi:hypothetical protein
MQPLEGKFKLGNKIIKKGNLQMLPFFMVKAFYIIISKKNLSLLVNYNFNLLIYNQLRIF